MEEQNKEQKISSLVVPGAIVLAGVLVAGAIFLTNGAGTPSGGTVANVVDNAGGEVGDVVLPVSAQDHIRGSLDAPVKLVEFSDLDCPFCQRFHGTMQQILNDYNGQVAWVYRHFPLTSIHPGALPAAIASECAGELGGDDGFWRFIDRYFDEGGGDVTKIASDIGLGGSEFESCLSDSKHASFVQAQYQDAIDSGGNGTPFSVVIAPNGEKFPIFGAQPYEEVRAIIEQALLEN